MYMCNISREHVKAGMYRMLQVECMCECCSSQGAVTPELPQHQGVSGERREVSNRSRPVEIDPGQISPGYRPTGHYPIRLY